MKTLRKVTFVIVLVCLICNAACFGEEAAKAKPELNIIISSKTYKLNDTQQRSYGGRSQSYGRLSGRGGYGSRRGGENVDEEEYDFGGGGKNEVATKTSSTDTGKKIKPTHVARTGGSKHLFVPSCFEPDALLATSSGKKMSDLQKEFVKQGDACDFSSITPNSILKMPRLSKTYLFSVSEDDAKKMASAFLESWHNNMGAEVQKLLEKTQEFGKKAAEYRKLYEEKHKEFDELEKRLKEKSSKGPHSLDGDIVHNSKAKDEAREVARQLYLKLNSANIEIEVIKARLSAATVYQARENGNPTVQAKLEDILCEQTIEMAGALERQAGITSILRQEEEIYKLYVQFSKAGEYINKYKSKSSTAEHNLKRANEEFENIDSSYPRTTENKVLIFPVKF